jgi:hypothetical protein
MERCQELGNETANALARSRIGLSEPRKNRGCPKKDEKTLAPAMNSGIFALVRGNRGQIPGKITPMTTAEKD